MSAPFLPRQAVKLDGALVQELQGGVSESIARQIVLEVSPLQPGILIHDNACGYGSVTGELMAAGVPEGVKIHATDINDGYLGQLRSTIEKNLGWDDTIIVDKIDMNNLTFEDNMFGISITDFAILGGTTHGRKVQEIKRVVKPDGLAIIGIWTQKPWQVALKEAHRRTRGDNTPYPPFLAVIDTDLNQLKDAIADAGFKDARYLEKEAWVKITDLERWSTIAWTFLSTPVGGWKQSDEDTWDEAVDICVEELKKGDHYFFEDGVHKIRMLATVAFAKKE